MILNPQLTVLSQFACCSGLLLVLGCGAEDVATPNPPVPVAEESEQEAPEQTESPRIGGEAYDTTIDGFTFTVPAGWQEAELSPAQVGIIAASFEVPEAGEDVSLTLSTVGGGVQANVDRWIGQFPDGGSPETEMLTVDGMEVTWLELRGTFSGMRGPFAGGADPKSDWMMIGVAFEGEPQDFYIKLTGPQAAVEDLEAEFRGFVESARVP